jgi:hypothetical protein
MNTYGIRCIASFSIVFAAAALSGCAMDGTGTPENGQETVGQSSEALVHTGGATIRWNAQAPTDFKLGPISSQTCFIQGLGGQLIGNPAYYSNPNAYIAARAGVYDHDKNGNYDGSWHMQVSAGTGAGVELKATCIDQVANRVTFDWQDNITTQGVPATPNRNCFLQQVWSTSGFVNNSQIQSHIDIKQSGGQFFIDGFVDTFAGDMEYGGARAVCVDVVAGSGWGFEWNAGSGTVAHNTIPVSPSGNFCGLTGIRGTWMTTGSDWNGDADGVYMNNWENGGFLADWQLMSTNFRGGSWICRQ